MNICDGLSTHQDTNKTALTGQWNFYSFAYTSDGISFENEKLITSCGNWEGTGNINIDSGLITVHFNNISQFKYSRSSTNKFNISPYGITTMKATVCHFEDKINHVFNNTQCIVVKGDRLFIHYKQSDNQNILILNKNE